MNDHPKDVCFTSMNILENRFNVIRATRAFVPDIERPNRLNVNPFHNDVLLMGRYVERIFQLEYWPNQPFNFFCLSTQVRKILIEIFEFHPDIIGHVSRYELFPVNQEHVTPFSINEDTHFFYSGRISAQKNIEFIIFTVFYLQFLLSKKIKLSLIGNFDNEHHRDIRGCYLTDYSIKIEKIINSLPWPGEKPIFKHNLNEQEWINHIPKNGIFLSASNFISEDFSVSAAQLQQIGQAQCLPWWGGFKDIKGENIKHFPVSYIANSNENLNEINSKAKKFARDLIQSTAFVNNTLSREQMKTIIPSHQIDLLYLKERIKCNLKKKGVILEYLINGEFSQFALSNDGQEILSKCREILAE